MMNCSHCGQGLPPESQFCLRCGTPVPQVPTGPSQPGQRSSGQSAGPQHHHPSNAPAGHSHPHAAGAHVGGQQPPHNHSGQFQAGQHHASHHHASQTPLQPAVNHPHGQQPGGAPQPVPPAGAVTEMPLPMMEQPGRVTTPTRATPAKIFTAALVILALSLVVAAAAMMRARHNALATSASVSTPPAGGGLASAPPPETPPAEGIANGPSEPSSTGNGLANAPSQPEQGAGLASAPSAPPGSGNGLANATSSASQGNGLGNATSSASQGNGLGNAPSTVPPPQPLDDVGPYLRALAGIEADRQRIQNTLDQQIETLPAAFAQVEGQGLLSLSDPDSKGDNSAIIGTIQHLFSMITQLASQYTPLVQRLDNLQVPPSCTSLNAHYRAGLVTMVTFANAGQISAGQSYEQGKREESMPTNALSQSLGGMMRLAGPLSKASSEESSDLSAAESELEHVASTHHIDLTFHIRNTENSDNSSALGALSGLMH